MAKTFFTAGHPATIVSIDILAQKGLANSQKAANKIRNNKKQGKAKVKSPRNHQQSGLKN